MDKFEILGINSNSEMCENCYLEELDEKCDCSCDDEWVETMPKPLKKDTLVYCCGVCSHFIYGEAYARGI
ncbi:MAG: hypothetical protein QXL94_01715 [Candidatus Parvarchaeum sp.]